MSLRIASFLVVLGASACSSAQTKPSDPPTSTGMTTSSSSSARLADAGAAMDSTTTDSSRSATGDRTRSETSQPMDTQTGRTGDQSADGTRTTPPSTRNQGATDMPTDATRTPAPSMRNPGTADRTKDADNTKVNKRDTTDALTPMDQGSTSTETKITAAVRKGIMKQDLSFTAKNVKVITVGGRVTLRGPVKSMEERAAIESIAQKTSGVQSVDNQLEVKE